MKPLVLNVQKYSIHDGDGIRTTIFFKGCPLKCLWCHNPESQSYESEMMYNKEKCTSCGRCAIKCPQQGIENVNGKYPVPRQICERCEACGDACFNEAKEIAGRSFSVEEIINEIEKDKLFYEQSQGGVTLSGGEVMTQNMDFIEKILKSCNKMGYRVNIDTCGFASYKNFEIVLPYVDTFLYDIKHMDDQKHRQLTGKGNQIILDNLRNLSDSGAKIHIRIPVIEKVNDQDQEMEAIADFIKNLHVTMVSLLPYHSIGESKYERIDMKYQGANFKVPNAMRMNEIKKIFENKNIPVKIGG